jgi:hypothetical protein
VKQALLFGSLAYRCSLDRSLRVLDDNQNDWEHCPLMNAHLDRDGCSLVEACATWVTQPRIDYWS